MATTNPRAALAASRRNFLLMCAAGSGTALVSLDPRSAFAADTPKRGGTLRVGFYIEAATMDPHLSGSKIDRQVYHNIYEPLVTLDVKLGIKPGLAESWQQPDSRTLIFKLRRGVKFHDGATMTAEDVKYSFDRVLEPGKENKKSPQYGNVRAIKEVKIVDADTIQLVTDKPFPLLLERLVYFGIVPKKHVEKVGEQAFGSTATVGTGPWKLVEWKRDQYIRLEAFDQHWRGKPPFKYVVFRAIPEVATSVAELKTGGVDIIRNVNADLLPDIRNHPQTRISTTPILRVHYISLDMRSAPFDKKAARQAANYAIDKQAMIQKMMAGLGKQVATVVQPPAFGFDPSVVAYPYDPKKAKELLAQAGYPNGVDITLHSSFVDYRPHFEALGQMLTEVGLRTTVKMWDPGPAWNKFFQAEGKATNGQYGSWGNYSVFDADAVLHPLYHTEPGGWIGKHYARVEGLDKLIDEGRSSVDQAKRKRIYAEIQRMIREEAPSVFLWTQNDTLGISKKVAYEARPDEWLWLFAAKPAN
jgi:peptide/nickel transport system substrate-binding protein